MRATWMSIITISSPANAASSLTGSISMMPSGSACMTPVRSRLLPDVESVSRQRAVPPAACWQHQVRMGIGSDVGAGTTFSMLRTLGEAYKVGQLQSYRLARLRTASLYRTPRLGGARALRLEEKIGNFQPGKEADFVVIDPAVTPLQRLRIGRCHDIYEQLFVLMTLGDERNISETWVNGERVWCQD
ncbi:amidohydrolase family protein [Klebsiella pneumoniae]|nr:amidohydrolase family protein [Klebsiella pneumoniae]